MDLGNSIAMDAGRHLNNIQLSHVLNVNLTTVMLAAISSYLLCIMDTIIHYEELQHKIGSRSIMLMEMEVIIAMAAKIHSVRTIGFAIFVSLIIVKIVMLVIKFTQLDDFY